MPKGQANLIFDKGPMTGFPALAEQSSVHPTTIVRELVQNSLDAAKEANREKAIIRFELETHKPADLPAFDVYKSAFNKAKKASHTQQDSAQSIIRTIERTIKAPEMDILFVMDNGVGLNPERMNALLADGISNKSASGAGSYGYGHTTVIPASNLRYMFYGGLCEGEKIAAGHAVLASFKDEREIKGKDGYFVVKKKEDMDNPFIYPTGKAIPDIISDKLETIQEWGSGSVVIITGFNYFSSGALFLRSDIEKAVACNFFAAVQEGKLEIEYKARDEEHTLNKGSIGNVLEQYKDEKRTEHFLNGYKAHKAYETMCQGQEHVVDTSLGKVRIKLREISSEGDTQINLCRNGMHISDKVPLLGRRDFTDYAPFHCLILVDSSDDAGGEFHNLIRKSEPPKHDEIARRQLDEAEKKKLNYALEQIKEYLKNNLTELESEEFEIRDVLNLNSYGLNTLEEIPPKIRTGGGKGSGGGSDGDGGSGGGGGDSNDSGTANSGFKRAGRAVSFRAIPVQTDKRSYAVQLALDESKYDNEIRFTLDESLDSTCDGTNTEDFVYLNNIKIDGEEPIEESLVKNEDGKVLGINLGSGDARQVNMTFDFELPGDIGIDNNSRVSLQAEMVRRQKEKVESE